MPRPTLEPVRVAGAWGLRAFVQYVPPRHRGLAAVVKTDRLLPKPRRPQVVRHPSGYRVTCDLTDLVQQAIFYRGTYEPVQSALICAELKPGDTFVDVGANCGHYVWLAASRVGARGRVHAIEPSAAMVRQLHTDVTRNLLNDRVVIHQTALSDTPGLLTLRTVDGAFPHAQRYLDASDAGSGEQVAVTTLDDLIGTRPVDVIKVDVEGADLRALVGARRILDSEGPRLVIVETVADQLARFGDSVADVYAFMRARDYVAEPIHERNLAATVAFRKHGAH